MPRTTATKPKTSTSADELLVEIRGLRKQTGFATEVMLGTMITLFSVVSAVFLPEVLFRLFYVNNVEALNQDLFALIPSIAYGVALLTVVYVVVRLVQTRRSA